MIQSVWVKNQNGEQLDIGLRESTELLGLVVFNIEGLGSPVATVNGEGGPGFDGIRVNSVIADVRQIMLTLAVTVNDLTEEDVKQKIYQYFPIKQNIQFGIVTDNNSVYADAIVESNEFNQFAKVENVVISMVCPNPYFVDLSEREYNTTFDSGIPLFEFPFSNESLTEPLLVFGETTLVPTSRIVYTANVATGIDISMIFNGNVEDVRIANSNGGQILTLDFTDIEAQLGSPTQADDQVIINTRVGEKSAYFVRAGVYYNILSAIGFDDDWIEIRPGINYVTISATTGQNLIESDIRFNPLREGV